MNPAINKAVINLIGTALLLCSATAGAQTITSRLNALEAKVNTLQQQLTNVMALNNIVRVQTVNGITTVRFDGVNVQIVNGAGGSFTANGKGNLIIGYDEKRPATMVTGAGTILVPFTCSVGTHPTTFASVGPTEAECLAAGGTWSLDNKSGSHYLVIGPQHNYTQSVGAVMGVRNTSNARASSVLGGQINVASGMQATVVGGINNVSSGSVSVVLGGSSNNASGGTSTVSGGISNKAKGQSSSVTGGSSNTASGIDSSIVGGTQNTASGMRSSISGGNLNSASAELSHVSGGASNIADQTQSSVLGGSAQQTVFWAQTIPALP